MFNESKSNDPESKDFWVAEPITTKEEAKIALFHLKIAVEYVESAPVVNLNKPILGTRPDGDFKKTKFTVDRMKTGLGLLSPEDRQLAEGLIIRAEIYLAAYEPEKESN